MRQELPACSLPCLICGFAALKMRARLRLLGQRVGIGRPDHVAVETLRPPDSALARSAEALGREAYADDLWGHGMRTWAFASVVAVHVGLRPDPEALYIACLLHDLGLTEAYDGPEAFELRGAAAAHDLCLPDRRRAELVHEAIALHTSVSSVLGTPEVRLVQTGSGGDLVGLDAELVHPQTRAGVLGRWPKSPEFVRSVVGALKRETAKQPRSPGAGLIRVGFEREVRGFHRRGQRP